MAVTTTKTTSLIDTLSAGYRLLNRRLWVLFIPLALNLYLLYGSRPVSIAPLLADAQAAIAELDLDVSPEQRETWDELLAQMVALGQQDLRGVLMLLNWLPVDVAADRVANPGALQIDNVGALFGLMVWVNIVALGGSALLSALLAELVRSEPTQPRVWLRDAGRVVVAVLCYVALVVLGLLILGLPFLVLLGILAGGGSGLAAGGVLVLVIVLQLVLSALFVFYGFAIEALLLDRVGPFAALRRSARLVWRHFWGTIGLLLLAALVTQGTLLVWQQLAEQPLGALLAVAGSCYIGTGLLVARLVFYRERAGTVTRPTL